MLTDSNLTAQVYEGVLMRFQMGDYDPTIPADKRREDLTKIFDWLCSLNRQQELEWILDNLSADLNFNLDKPDNNSLFWLCYFGNAKLLEKFIDASHIDVSACFAHMIGVNKEVSVETARKSRRQGTVHKKIINTVAAINTLDQLLYCPLGEVAFRNGNIDCMRLLIERGNPVNPVRPNMLSPLGRVFGFRENEQETPSEDTLYNACEFLLDNGANPNPSNEVIPPLAQAILSKSFKCVLLLLDRGADMFANAPTLGGPIFIYFILTMDSSPEALIIFERMCEKIKDWNIRAYNMSLLAVAAKSKALPERAWQVILEKCANQLNQHDDISPLHHAVANQDIAKINDLLAAGADVHAIEIRKYHFEGVIYSSKFVNTLEIALDTGNEQIARILISYGAKVQENALKPAYQMIVQKIQQEEQQMRKKMFLALDFGVKKNDFGLLNRLLQDGNSPDIYNEDGITLLQHATITGNVEAVKILLEHNASVYFSASSGLTTLNYLRSHKTEIHPEILQLFSPYLSKRTIHNLLKEEIKPEPAPVPVLPTLSEPPLPALKQTVPATVLNIPDLPQSTGPVVTKHRVTKKKVAKSAPQDKATTALQPTSTPTSLATPSFKSSYVDQANGGIIPIIKAGQPKPVWFLAYNTALIHQVLREDPQAWKKFDAIIREGQVVAQKGENGFVVCASNSGQVELKVKNKSHDLRFFIKPVEKLATGETLYSFFQYSKHV